VNVLIAVSFLLATPAGGAMAANDPKFTLIRTEQQWNQALKSKDIGWFEERLAADFTDVSSGDGSFHTKAENVAALKTDTTTYETLELSELQARIEGNAGIVTGVNHIVGHDDRGNAFDVRLRFTDTYIRREGKWLVWASQHTRMK
jgi:ketosteroid isomerase-like protein